MKKIFTGLFLLLSVAVFAQSKVENLVKFDKESFDFGKTQHNKPATVEFTFTNIGKTPVIIESATAECGCTTPEFPKTPVMAGKTGKIKVTYDAKTVGSFTKRVTVKLVNVADSKVLTITGDVQADKQ